jgi:hypothetical protein
VSTFQRAKEHGAKIIQDIWEESDENGAVRFARVQTVSVCVFRIILVLNEAGHFSQKPMSHMLDCESRKRDIFMYIKLIGTC